jgi:uncharacterized repeat protein (TIGR02543 family)
MKHLLHSLLCIFTLLIFASGCSMFNDPMTINKGIQIVLSMDPETQVKTYSPNFSTPYLSMFEKIVISVNGVPATGGTFSQEFINPATTILNVPYGSYTISVKAFLKESDAAIDYAAYASIQFVYSSTNRYAFLNLKPIATEGSGLLKYKLTDTGAVKASAILLKYGDLSTYPVIVPGPNYPYPLIVDGQLHQLSVPSGYYAVIFGNNTPHVLHIYKNYETLLDLQIETLGKTSAPAPGIPAGIVASGTAVTLSSSTQGAVIFYTTDGSAPSMASAVYQSPIQIMSSPTTIRAIASRVSMLDSDMMTATYIFKTATPTANPSTGALPYGSTVTLSCVTQGAVIYYTTDGSTPSVSSAVYAAPISVTGAVTIKAVAFKEGMAESDVLTAQFTLVNRTVTFRQNYDDNAVLWTRTVPDGGSIGANMPADPERDEYFFIGWNSLASGTGNSFTSASVVTGNISVYAQWEEM